MKYYVIFVCMTSMVYCAYVCVFALFHSPSIHVRSGTLTYPHFVCLTRSMWLQNTSCLSAATPPQTCIHWEWSCMQCLTRESQSFRSTSRTSSRASADSSTRWVGENVFITRDNGSSFKLFKLRDLHSDLHPLIFWYTDIYCSVLMSLWTDSHLTTWKDKQK